MSPMCNFGQKKMYMIYYKAVSAKQSGGVQKVRKTFAIHFQPE